MTGEPPRRAGKSERRATRAERRRIPRGGRRAADSSPGPARLPARSAPLILVVDDYPDGREMTADYLGSLGFRVAEAATGAEAITMAGTLQPQVVLLDLALPDMDGWQVLSTLRESDLTKDIKVAIHTADVTAPAREQARKWGVDLFLPRPCDMDVLARQLAAAAGAKAGRKRRAD